MCRKSANLRLACRSYAGPAHFYCTLKRLPFRARRWRRRRRRLADGSAAGWPTSRPRFGKATAFPKPQPGRASEAAPDPQPLCPIHTGSLSASHPSPTARQTAMVLCIVYFHDRGIIEKEIQKFMILSNEGK